MYGFFMMRSGVLLAFTAVLLQIAVFLQPLLPAKYQVAPVCETITQALLLPVEHHHAQSEHHAHVSSGHDHHDANHQCQYCTVYGNLILPPELSVREVLDSIKVRFHAWQNSIAAVWLILQRLFLLPQGRAPPLFA